MFSSNGSASPGIRFNPAEAGGDAAVTPKPVRGKPAPQPPTPPGTLCLSSVGSRGDRQLDTHDGCAHRGESRSSFKPSAGKGPNSADLTPSRAQLRTAPRPCRSQERPDPFRGQWSRRQASPRDMQSTQPCCRRHGPCLLPDLSALGAGTQAARRTQGRIQLAALPRSLPSPSPPGPTHRSGSDGAEHNCFGEQTPSEGDPLCSPRPLHLPSVGWAWPAAPWPAAQPGTGMEGALAPSREAWAAGGAGALRGVGSSGALDAGYRSWPWACWSPASPDWKLLPADGCLAAGTERGPEAFQMAEAGRTGRGQPRPGGSEMPYAGKALLRTRAAGDSSTARPFPVPPDPPEMLGHPACPPCASPNPFQLEGPNSASPRGRPCASVYPLLGETGSG